MSEQKTTAINYIFYLQSTSELGHHFYDLSQIFSQININLIPVNQDELKIIDRSKKHHLIVLRDDLSSALYFNQVRKFFLDGAIASGRICLFDVSSFSEIEQAAKFENKNLYHYFQLPMTIKQIAMSIALNYFRDRNMQEEWPGGKRSKLPVTINDLKFEKLKI